MRRGHDPASCLTIARRSNAAGCSKTSSFCHFDWEVTYDAEGYLRLLDTFSGHLAMQAWQRDRLYGEIRHRLAQRANGRLRRHWGAVLQVARRAHAPRPVSATPRRNSLRTGRTTGRRSA
jgi:hypothetical protein